jgi:RNA polymerase sigma factor (sigma-70 family)
MARQAAENEGAARLYDALGPALFRYALMILGRHDAAEDVIQQVFTAVLDRGLQHIATPETYLRTAVRNARYSRLRGTLVRSSDTSPGEEILEAVPQAREPIPAEDRLALDAGIRALPPEQGEVVHLHVFEGLTFKGSGGDDRRAHEHGRKPIQVRAGETARQLSGTAMTDEQLEELLLGARPRGPSAELRARILARPAVQAVQAVQAGQAGQATKRAWPWAVAAAALLGFTFLLQTASAGLRHRVREANAVAAPDIENELTIALRESGLSEEDARLIAMVHQVQMRIEQSRPAAERPEP